VEISVIDKHIDKVEELQDIVVESSDRIIEQIDVDALMADPKGYLEGLTKAFVEDHLDEIAEAEKEGVRFGKAINSAE